MYSTTKKKDKVYEEMQIIFKQLFLYLKVYFMIMSISADCILLTSYSIVW